MATGEEVFLTQLEVIDRAIAFVCRRQKLSPVDAEDFSSHVKLKLIENDYAILQKFEGRCSFGTYITVVVQRLLLDERIHEWGKWHPSAEARRFGESGILLETLLMREGLALADAIRGVRRLHPAVEVAELEALAGRLPQRRPRNRRVELEVVERERPVPAASAEESVLNSERTTLSRRAAEVLRQELEQLGEEDSLILRMRFHGAMSVAEIARVLRLDQKTLYRRMNRHLQSFREKLRVAGISGRDLHDLIGAMPDDDGGFGFIRRPAPAHLREVKTGEAMS